MNPATSALPIDPWFFVAGMGVLGLLIGSFLNVVIHRLPRMMEREWKSECRQLLGQEESDDGAVFNLVTPRSRCPHCERQIAAIDNVPVLSYVLLGGKCRHCRQRISPRYPVVEFVSGALAAYAAWRFGPTEDGVTGMSAFAAVAAAIYSWYLLALALIDYDTQLLPDSMTLPLLWFGIACAFFGPFAPDLASAVLGAMFGYLSLWSVYWLFKLVTGKEGMGYGDFKLLAALGAWLGWQALPTLILVSSAVGAVIGIGLIATGLVKRSQPIPFGPYLAIAGIIAMHWQDELAALFSFGRTL
ncbi:MAG: prepilin peptidase [Gammaproteobacteria bacterium]|nr:prepilin peptidase [Gammaproteobacteria bacterium]MCP5199373.1 prepilin peptidase [Gammaproteobacteria bacterium]